MDNVTALLGLALRAGRLAAGEEAVEVVCRAHKAYLMLLASDAAENTIRRAGHIRSEKTVCLTIPLTKEELGSCLGRASCAIAVISEIGFAASLAEKLAQMDPATYGDARDTLTARAARFKKRRDDKRAQQKKTRTGKPSARK